MRQLNWKKGLIRLWLLTTAVWIIASGIVMRPDKSFMDWWYLDRESRAEILSLMASDSAGGILSKREREIIKNGKPALNGLKDTGRYVVVAVVPTLSLLALGFGAGWVRKGFIK